MQANGSSSDGGLTLAGCDSSEQLQKFKYADGKFSLAIDDTKCLQAGRSTNEPPSDGHMVRVEDCIDDESLQLFSWSSSSGGAITTTAYPDFCVVSRGETANLGGTIIVKLCSILEPSRLDGWMLIWLLRRLTQHLLAL